jgi:hypothetical protein
MDAALFAVLAAAYVALVTWGLRLAAGHGWASPANLPLLVVLGLVYDNTVIATGGLIGEGALLEGLSLGRFWIHAFLTPTLVVWAWHVLSRAGVHWARTRAAAVVALVIATVLVVLEIVTVLAGLQLEAQEQYGVLSYTEAEAESGGGAPLMPLVVAGALIVAGVGVWRRLRWPWLLLGALAMSVGSAVDVPVPSAAVTNVFELALLTSVVATTARQDRRQRRDATRERAAAR